MTTLQTEFTEQELLLDAPVAEPLFARHSAGEVRCHGGFDTEGRYVSPRMRFRGPGIVAWQEKHREDFGEEPMDIPLETWPAHFPTVEQARYLLDAGVIEPLAATLTRIGTVEGFGANIRLLQPGDMQQHFEESITGTAIDHLGRGLFEAHGRDEAGWEKEAGHKDMWFAARDVAFDNRPIDLDVDAMLERMGFGGAGSELVRVLPEDIDVNLEVIASLMTRVLFIEISAFHTFKWAEAWLSDDTRVAGEGRAADLVSYIRADETPHVGYLKTALTEMRDRTWVGTSGAKYKGKEMIDLIWDKALAQSLVGNRKQSLTAIMGEVEHWVNKRKNGGEIMEGFLALGNPLADIEEAEASNGAATY
ncbi:MAG TPA: hypothetical protein VEA78_08680 [Acidimicrobiales bacterium]|nr:hypothetical protein [Acidimicrobiales bacterium]